MTAGERLTREEIIGKQDGMGYSWMASLLMGFQHDRIENGKRPYVRGAKELWRIATELGEGDNIWGAGWSDGWTFEELEDDLEELVRDLGRYAGPEGTQTLAGALLRREFGEEPPEWIIPGLLQQGDRMMITGETGAGKSLLLAQIGVQVAAGIHPFTGAKIEPRRVLIVDPENPRDEIIDRLGTLSLITGDAWGDAGRRLHFARPPELNLSTDEGWAWLDDQLIETWANLILIGPLNRIVRGDLNDKTTADPILDGLNAYAERNKSIILEAHPTKNGGAGEPSGYGGWKSWPEIGIGITKTGTINPWRPPRRDGIILPSRLERDQRWDRSRWPFRAVTTESTSSTGTAGDLSSVVLDFLERHDEEEFSRSRLGDQLRGEGATFSNRALPAAIESLIEKGSITEKKIGKASILRILRNPPSLSAEDTKEPRKSIEPSSSGGASLEAPEEDGSEDRDDDLGGPDEEHDFETDGEWEEDDDLF